MSLDKLNLTLKSEGYEYEMYPILNVSQNTSKDAMSIALPGQSPRDNILMGLSGMESNISIDFVIYNDGTDKANGSYSSTIVTLSEQIDYLFYTIHDPAFDAKWELNHSDGDMFNNEEVSLEKIDIPYLQSDTEKWLEARMDLRIGKSI